MKSAYELAMERLNRDEPQTPSLSAAQKKQLAEIDSIHKGKWAEREIFLKEKLETALDAGDATSAEQIRQQLISEKARIEEEREAQKERVRRQ